MKIYQSNYIHSLSYSLGCVELKNSFFMLLEPSKLFLFDKNGFFIFSHKIIDYPNMFEPILKI